MEIDSLYMRRALQLARNGYGSTSPNPMVGAVIVDPQGNIIGEGWHRKFGEAHAEVNAVNSVIDKSKLSQSTIYVTLEPCSHYGKTPPCAELLVKCQFRRLVIGVTDPNEKVSGRGISILRNAGIEVCTGVLEEECRQLNPAFMTAHAQRRPYVLLKWACSSDGYLDCQRQADQPAPKFSTPQTLTLMHRIRAGVDAIMIGSETALNDNPSLATRLYPGRSPQKIVIDARGRINTSLHIFNNAKPIVVTTQQRHPAEECAEILHLDDPHNISQILDALFRRGITSVMVEGGATLLDSIISQGLWDEARIEVNPRICLGNNGRVHMEIPSGITSTKEIDGNTIINVKNQ